MRVFLSICIVSARHRVQNSRKAREKIKCFYILGQCADKFFIVVPLEVSNLARGISFQTLSHSQSH